MIKRYNGTAWNAVTYCKNFNGTEQFTYFPVVANTFANAISSWTIKGNEQHTGTPAPGNPIRGVGEETANLCNVTTDTNVFLNLGSGSGYGWTINADKTITNPEGKAFYGGFRIKVEPNTTYTCHCVASYNGQMRLAEYSDVITDLQTNRIRTTINVTIKQPGQGYGTASFTTTAETKWVLFYFYIDGSYSPNTLSDIMFLEGEYDRYTIPDYIPYGYKIPISSGNATTPVYISAPLRKSLDGTVFDTLDSTGLVTYNVDEYGAPLVTPTTTTVTVPTITSALGRTVISFGTSIQPSEFDMTYHGWHSHIPSIRSNNAWS